MKKTQNNQDGSAGDDSLPLLVRAETSIEHMAARGMVERLRCLAADMEETGDALQLCEDNIDLDGAFSKGSEMKGAADMARDWAQHIESKYFPANVTAQGMAHKTTNSNDGENHE